MLARRAVFALATSERLEQGVRRAPGGEAAAWRVARRYVAGLDAEEALARARALRAEGLSVSLDLFGERERDLARADTTAQSLAALAARLPDGAWLSLDLSHLALAADPPGARRRLARVLDALPPGARLQVGAEEAALTDAVLDAVLAAAAPERLTATLQANLRRSPADAERLAAAGVGVRLV